MRYFLVFALFCMGILSATGSQAQITKQSVIIAADQGYSPYSYVNQEKQKLEGIYIQIVTEVFAKMAPHYDVTLKPLPWKKALEATQKEQAFAVLPPYKHPNLRPWLSYSIPLFTEKLAAFCSGADSTWPKDYEGKKVIINAGFNYPAWIIELLQRANATILYAQDNDDAISILNHQQASCYINDEYSVFYLIKQHKLKDLHKKADLSQEDTYLAYNHDKKAFPYGEDFIKEFNRILGDMKKSGAIDRIVKKYTSY